MSNIEDDLDDAIKDTDKRISDNEEIIRQINGDGDCLLMATLLVGGLGMILYTTIQGVLA